MTVKNKENQLTVQHNTYHLNSPKNVEFSSTTKSSTPWKVQLFPFLQIVHIKQRGTAFQIIELPCLPNQFIHHKVHQLFS